MPNKGNTNHVVYNPSGGWGVNRGVAVRSSGHFPTQQVAIDCEIEISGNQKTELKIHEVNRRIRQSDSHGNDPYPLRG